MNYSDYEYFYVKFYDIESNCIMHFTLLAKKDDIIYKKLTKKGCKYHCYGIHEFIGEMKNKLDFQDEPNFDFLTELDFLNCEIYYDSGFTSIFLFKEMDSECIFNYDGQKKLPVVNHFLSI